MIRYFSWETEVGLNAEVLGRAIGVHTGEGHLVGAIWGVGWNTPLQLNIEGIRFGSSEIFVVLVVEWGTVPVNMDVHIADIDIAIQTANEVEGNVRSLDQWVWGGGGAVGVEGEDTLVVRALRPGDLTIAGLDLVTSEDVLGLVGGALDQLWQQVDLHEVLDVEWGDLDNLVGGDSGGSGQGEEGGEFHFLKCII